MITHRTFRANRFALVVGVDRKPRTLWGDWNGNEFLGVMHMARMDSNPPFLTMRGDKVFDAKGNPVLYLGMRSERDHDVISRALANEGRWTEKQADALGYDIYRPDEGWSFGKKTGVDRSLTKVKTKAQALDGCRAHFWERIDKWISEQPVSSFLVSKDAED